MQHIFLADVHLGAFHEEKNRELENSLIRLVDYCSTNSIQIHLLGDLFDYWMEYENYVPPLGNKLLNRFKKYNRQQQATFIAGNHDFWTRGHFSDLGFEAEPEYKILELNDSAILMFHGDGLSDKNFAMQRPFLNNLLRKKWFVDAFQYILGGEAGNHFMKVFSEFTRDEDDINPKTLSDWAKLHLEKTDVDVIITGHDHVPRIETFDGGLYINPGAYHRYKTVIFYTNGSFRLVVWDGTNGVFKPFAFETEQTKQS